MTGLLGIRKSKFLLENEQVLRAHHPAAYEAAVNSSVRCREGRVKSSQELCSRNPFAQDLQELLSHVVPFAGYSSDKDYFAHENPVPWQEEAKKPLWAASTGDCCVNTGSQPPR